MMRTLIIAVGGTGHHVALAWEALRLLRRDAEINSEKLRWVYLDSDTGGGAIQGGDAAETQTVSGVLAELSPNADSFFYKQIHVSKIDEANEIETFGDVFANDNDLSLFDDKLKGVKISEGFYGYPSLGATVSRLQTNLKQKIEELLNWERGEDVSVLNGPGAVPVVTQVRVIVVGSSIGGTGSGVGPALIQILREQQRNKKVSEIIYITYIGKMTIRSTAEDVQQIRGALGDLFSNSLGAITFVKKKGIWGGVSRIALAGTPPGYVEERKSTANALSRQPETSTVIHLLMANAIRYFFTKTKPESVGEPEYYLCGLKSSGSEAHFSDAGFTVYGMRKQDDCSLQDCLGLLLLRLAKLRFACDQHTYSIELKNELAFHINLLEYFERVFSLTSRSFVLREDPGIEKKYLRVEHLFTKLEKSENRAIRVRAWGRAVNIYPEGTFTSFKESLKRSQGYNSLHYQALVKFLKKDSVQFRKQDVEGQVQKFVNDIR